MTKPYDIPKALVWEAYKSVKANGGSAGIDRESLDQFESRLSGNLYKLWNRMCSGSYIPPPVKGVAIPKKSGGVRILGVPTVADRVAQTVVKRLLEPVIDPIFHTNSYGYRPGRSAHDAIAMVRRRSWEYDWVIEFDIKGLFDNIEHDLLMRAGATEALSDAMGAAVRRALAESANANAGRRACGKDARYTARRSRQSFAGQSVSALCIRQLGRPSSSKRAILPLCR